MRKTWLVALLVIGILSPLIFISSALSPWQGAANILQEVVYPFELLWHSVSNSTVRTWNTYVALNHAAKENIELQRQLSEIKTRTIDHEEQSLEIKRLRELLGFAQHYEKRLLVAEVIG